MRKDIISFSGGRTSAMMAIEMAERGMLDHATIQFADTGREYVETYDFINKVEELLGREILRLEAELKVKDGTPFDNLVTMKKMLPNQNMRFCTNYLKVFPMQQLMIDFHKEGFDEFSNVIGLRHDEPRRINARARNVEFAYHREKRTLRKDVEKVASQRNADQYEFIDYELRYPMNEWGYTQQDVDDFWEKMPFDLETPFRDSNCTLCPMKGFYQKVKIVGEYPELAKPWLDDEAKVGAQFRKEYSTQEILNYSATGSKDIEWVSESLNCVCTD